MGTYGSAVTSWRMISCGNSGANASGPNGRSGTRLYQLSGSALSSSKNFVGSMRKPPFSNPQPVGTSAYRVFGRRVAQGQPDRYAREYGRRAGGFLRFFQEVLVEESGYLGVGVKAVFQLGEAVSL